MSHSLIPMYHPSDLEEVLVYLAVNPTTLPQLPTEVWERVLDELDVSDWYYYGREPTFSACCMICRAWLPRSRYHLFKQVRVWTKGQVKQVSKLLHSNPVLRTRVEKLTVRGSDDAKKDASWVGLVGFHLGPKLKALETITLRYVDFSLTTLDSYQLWGAFNKAWQPGVGRKLHFHACTVTHANQLVRLAFVTKARELDAVRLKFDEKVGPALPVPVLPRGISLPLRKLTIRSDSPELIATGSWHTLARRCPSLSTVEIVFLGASTRQFPDNRLFLVSIFDMFRCMQRHNDTNHILFSGTGYIPRIEMRTRPDGTNAGNAPPAARPHLRRELVLDTEFSERSIGRITHALACFEDAMVPGATNVSRGFHHIELNRCLARGLNARSCRPVDTILSRLRVTTPDAHMVIKREGQLPNECVLPQMRRRFPKFCQLLPNAFCDPDGGQPCPSHPTQASGNERGQGVEVEEAMAEETTGGQLDGEVFRTNEMSEPSGLSKETSEEVKVYIKKATRKRKATKELEVGEEGARGKRRRAE